MYYIKVITFGLFFLPQLLLATWSVSTDGRTASTPSPYSNNMDETTTLTDTNGNTTLTVYINGEMESDWDFVYITDSAGNTRIFDGTIDTSFTAVGPTITLRYTTDFSETRAGVRVSLDSLPDFTSNNPRDFTKIDIAGQSGTNIYGDLMLIGNQSLCWKGLTYNGRRWVGTETLQCQNPPSAASNNDYWQRHANLDPIAVSAGYLNSTSADLTIGPDDRVIEAWLFVIGRLDTDDQALRASAQNVRLKTPTSGGYISLQADTDKFNWMVDNSIFDYGIAINVTQYVQQSGRYWVADLKATEMLNQGSGWGIAIIVEDTTSQNRTLKNISLYNGFNGVYSIGNYPATVTSDISGFFTPRTGTVKSNLIVMAGESDRSLSDSMRITKKDGTEVNIQDSLSDTQNVQNGTISKNGSNVTTRNPNYENTLGIDIDEIDVSDIIENEQTSTEITIDSFGDRIFLSMYGFATELYMPELCYDYNIQKNGFSLNVDEGRNFTINGLGEIKAHVSIRSKEGDFDLENSKLKFYLEPSDKFSFLNAQYSPNTVNTLIPAITTLQHTAVKPEIAVGENANTNGGTISIYERYFAQYNFNILENETNEVHFNIELNTSIDFGSGPVEFILSAQNNTLPRCDQNLTYNPLLGAFNIERVDSGDYDSVSQPQERYPLYTQVANKAFDFSVVAYDVNASPSYMRELTMPSPCVVEIELIDSAPYNDEGSFFKCQNTQEDIIQTLPNGEKSMLIQIASGTSRTDIADTMYTQNALWNAAFRVWYYTDNVGNLVVHDCGEKIDGACFRENVYDKVKLNTSTDFCASDCSSANDSTDSCYTCLRKFYATPVCSRDNFAIKPASYHIRISDNNESNDTTATKLQLSENITSPLPISIAAGYGYKIEVEATQFGNNNKANGYTTLFTTPSDQDKQSTAFYNDTNMTGCADTSNPDWGVWFENGEVKESISGTRINLQSNNLVSISNVGNYNYHIEDSNWTIVDQSRYVDKDGNKLKTFPDVDDCITSGDDKYSIASDGDKLSGCGITSKIDYTGGPNPYEDLPLTVQPYSFDLSQIAPIRRPARNILFMNDLSNDDYYGNILSAKLSQATSFEGNITALGKQNTPLSNFTDGCAATNVILDLRRTMSPLESTLTDDAPLQQYLEIGVDVVDAQEGIDKNITVPKIAFEENHGGSATVRLHTTLKKPIGFGNAINPVQVQYNALFGNSPDATSNTHMASNYIPEGENTYDQNTTYVYGKVTPLQRLYENVEESFIQTPLYVDIFCDDTLAPLEINDCINTFGLNIPSKGTQEKESDWHLATLFANNELGTTDITASHLAENDADPFVSVDGGTKSKIVSDASFNDNQATQNDINVSVAGPNRNSMVKVKYDPAPWLIYDEDEDFFRVHFIGPSSWAGVGKTGHVTDTASSRTKNNRMNW